VCVGRWGVGGGESQGCVVSLRCAQEGQPHVLGFRRSTTQPAPPQSGQAHSVCEGGG
jgi:hypothetical protein